MYQNLDLISLPIDILYKIENILDSHKSMFLYTLFSSKKSHQYINLINKDSPILDNNGKRTSWNILTASPLINLIHNALTYSMMFKKVFIGRGMINDTQSHSRMFNSLFENSDDVMRDRFELIKEMHEYLYDLKPKKSNIHIEWENEIIGYKKRRLTIHKSNVFWTKSLSHIKSSRFAFCRKNPFCTICKKKCRFFDVKLEDKLIINSKNDNSEYVCIIKSISLDNDYFNSVRSVYIKYQTNYEQFLNTILPRIKITVKLLPFAYQSNPKNSIITISSSDQLYYKAHCYTRWEAWGRIEKNKKNIKQEIIIDNVYDMAFGMLHAAKRDNLYTALAVI